jgi:hypothetical protein
MSVKINLPNQVASGIPNINNLTSEAQKYEELFIR